MPSYIIQWNAGWGSSYEEVEADTVDAALKIAYENAREEFESNADWRCLGEATDELRDTYL